MDSLKAEEAALETGLTDEQTKKFKEQNLVVNKGFRYLCSNVKEKVPSFDPSDCEICFPDVMLADEDGIMSRNHNHQIVFGRDRHGNFATGAGGSGYLQSGMIDLVAGRGHLIIQNNKKNNNPDILEGVKKVGPMFHSDAARVYITQKSLNIDRYFALDEGRGPTSQLKSAVAIKADHLRFIGREKVKIYVGRGDWNGFANEGETNCLGERINNPVIEFQVGNQETHPMVLGNKLVRYLKKKNRAQKKIYQALFQINSNLIALNSIVSLLPGAGTVLSALSSEAFKLNVDAINANLNVQIQEIDALETDLGITGENHILSDSVFTS